MRELKRLIEEAKKNISNGWGSMYEKSVPFGIKEVKDHKKIKNKPK